MLNRIFTEYQLSLAEKVLANQRISINEALNLFHDFSLSQLSFLSSERKRQVSGLKIYFNRNIHVEPTNICVYQCRFCSYRAMSSDDSYIYTADDIISRIEKVESDITEVHITGGVHPEWGIKYFSELIAKIHSRFPKLHIKAFTAVEIEYMCMVDGISHSDGLKALMQSGLKSLPGGGAEIFDEEIRLKISPEKSSGKIWLDIHKIAHELGMKTTATMLYGHVENYEQRVKHMYELRALQDETGGFQAFIPLKFRRANNPMSDVEEVSLMEDLKNYSVSRIFLDNFPHLKAYWPAIGKNSAQMSLLFGVDDLDGTINDSTSIYSRAGAEQSPQMNSADMIQLIHDAGYSAVERNSLYETIREYRKDEE
ncbi:MAG: CofH family radical SAM protein [Bacteroidales bacterium]|nr:CofH family radical SAM protein [Bacteroidales bacterium]